MGEATEAAAAPAKDLPALIKQLDGQLKLDNNESDLARLLLNRAFALHSIGLTRRALRASVWGMAIAWAMRAGPAATKGFAERLWRDTVQSAPWGGAAARPPASARHRHRLPPPGCFPPANFFE